MTAVAVFILPGLVCIIGQVRKWPPAFSWLGGCIIGPASISLAESVFPYQGGGASFAPLGLFFAIVYSAISGTIGLWVGSLLSRLK